MSSNSNRWSHSDVRQLFLIAIIFIAACIETDIYLPAFPDMMKIFAVNAEQIQGVLTWNFFGLCFSGPIYGPISDTFGRRKPLLLALCLFFLGSLITVWATHFSWLILGRALQGLGSGGCFTLGSAIIFDVFSQTKALTALNYLNTLIPTAMALAPLSGGYLNSTYGYRANFIAVLFVVFLSWVVCVFFFKETLPIESRKSLQFSKLKQDFGRVITSFSFWQMNLPVCLLFGGYLAFLSTSSIFFVMELGVSKADYPFFQASVLLGWLIASLTSSPVLQKFGAQRAKQIGIAMLFIGFLGFQLTCWIAPTHPVALTFFMIIYSFGYNWIQTPYFGEIMGLMPDIKGILGSIVTSCRLLLAALVVEVSAYFYNKSILSFSLAMWGIALVVGPMIWLRERDRTAKQREDQILRSEIENLAPSIGH